ncbi:MAG: tetratricopeptide repeat protein [Candidatus Omnitrophota bacterium]
MTPSKIDRKELQRRLKEDELTVFLQEFYENARVFFSQYGKMLGLTLLLIIVVGLAGYFWRTKSTSDFNEAQILFGNGAAFITQGQYEEALGEYNKLLESYPNQKIAKLTLVQRGNCYFKINKYAEALNDYKAALPGLELSEAISVRIAMVQTFRSLGQFNEAITELDGIEKEAQSNSLKQYLLFLKGGCYEDMDQPEKALDSYRAIPADSAYYMQALERIEWLETKPVGAIN